MDPLNPWLNPSEVRQLAEQLLRPMTPKRLTATDPGFNSSFVGFTESNQQNTDDQPNAQKAEIAPVPSRTKSSPPAPPAPVSEEERVQQRIGILRAWLADRFRVGEIFILDENGDLLFQENDQEKLHQLAKNLSSDTSEHQGGNVHVQIGPGSVLEVIPAETAKGRVVLGALVPASLPAASVQTITEVLCQTFS